VLDRVAAGEVRFLAPPFLVTAPEAVEIVGGTEQTLELEVAAQASLSGTVRRNGVPVPYARVNLNGAAQVALQTDREGRYRADGLRAGTYGYVRRRQAPAGVRRQAGGSRSARASSASSTSSWSRARASPASSSMGAASRWTRRWCASSAATGTRGAA
jgi:hypothetical protein